MPAIHTNTLTAHHAMPVSDWVTGVLSTKRYGSGEAAPRMPAAAARECAMALANIV